MSIKLASQIQGPVAVIGDVHGQTEKLLAILRQLEQLPDFQDRWIVFIGDFVDRGPNPRGAVQIFLDLLKHHPKTTAVAGNHEFAMGGALGWYPTPDNCEWDKRWVEHYDSDTTFASYQCAHGDLADLGNKLPPRHREVLSGLPWVVEHPRLLFVHAGLDPNTPFSMQLRILQQKDYTLNRPQWLCSKSFVKSDPPTDCPVPVVSGHVYVPAVELRPRRILVDTTGGTTGELSCVLLPEKRVITSAGPATATVAAGGGEKPWWKVWS